MENELGRIAYEGIEWSDRYATNWGAANAHTRQCFEEAAQAVATHVSAPLLAEIERLKAECKAMRKFVKEEYISQSGVMGQEKAALKMAAKRLKVELEVRTMEEDGIRNLVTEPQEFLPFFDGWHGLDNRYWKLNRVHSYKYFENGNAAALAEIERRMAL
jgi:hypothetical protein